MRTSPHDERFRAHPEVRRQHGTFETSCGGGHPRPDGIECTARRHRYLHARLRYSGAGDGRRVGGSTVYLDGIEAQTGQGNRGRDWAVGAGLRFGWYGELIPGFTGGAFYATKVHYSPFTKYSAILADSGRVDQPASFDAGLAYRVTPKMLVAFDFLRYLYADVPVFGNSFPGNGILGSKDGPGFGWRNQNVFRIGVSYDLSSKITLRAGFAEASSQIVSNNTAFSFAAPLTTRHNLTLGATYHPMMFDEISVAYSHGFRAAVKGTGDSLNAMTSPYNTVNFVAFGYSRKF